MRVADMMRPDGHVFLKSEWAPISDYWPAVSFTKRSVGIDLGQRFKPGRDILIYVGTTSELTRDPAHRSRILSAVVPEPNRLHETRKIIPAESWAWSMNDNGARWPHSLAIVQAASIAGPPYPYAREIVPKAYASFAAMENRGWFVEAIGDERDAVMALEVIPLHLNLAPDVIAYLGLRASLHVDIPKSVKQEVSRMAMLIIDRVNSGGEVSVRTNPIRFAPNISELSALLTRLWQDDQGGDCALCGAPIHATTGNEMMKASADRIDSTNGAYNESNVQITHLACNLAKNQWGLDHFEEWIAALRGVDVTEDVGGSPVDDRSVPASQ
ncbi:hypothetical protein [Rhizobium leguminosarum]|uniref:hypothetical protein n=1 Tax=Rhizobium leguminosarum TaxID=384 RepID=UPI001AEBD64D|nr:hypothetical protein [Rhizobium leguminosarum]